MIRLAIDCDGVLCDFIAGFSRILNEIRPGAIPHDYQPDSWNGFTESGLVTPDENRVAWSVIRDRAGFWTSLPPYVSNVGDLATYLRGVDMVSREVYFLTSRFATGGESAQYQTVAWLRTHWIHHANVIVVDRMEDKVKIADTLKFTAIVDDNLETVYDLRNAGHNAYLLDRPWNRVPTDFEDYRVSTLHEFLKREGGLVDAG